MSADSNSARLDVVALGNAIVDVLGNVSDDFLAEHDLPKGAMTLVDEEQAKALQSLLGDTVGCSGGSAANTTVGVASLGGRCAYAGKVRDDALGDLFRDDIRKAGVEFETTAAVEGPGTGRCLVFVTPDAQRTLQTFLGASATLGPSDVDAGMIAAAKVVYLEGYLWDPPAAKEAFREAARIAREHGRQVALSLSDAFCVDRHRDEFRELVDHHVDLLFANEVEILSLYGTESFDEAVRAVAGKCTAALTRGEKGSVVVRGSETVEVPAAPVERVVDTTGAGDLYAAGFLFGWTRGADLAACARLGGLSAAEVISHYGARPQVPLRELAASAIEAFSG